MSKLIESTLKLFKAVPIEKRKKKQSKECQKIAIKEGFILSPYVIGNYDDCKKIVRLAKKYLTISGEDINKSFHKSWVKVKEADIEQLVVEQLAHYVTTYGKENPVDYIEEKSEQWGVENLGGKIIGLGDFVSDKIYDADYVYIPKEVLEVPEFEGVNLILIKGYTKEELKEKVLSLLNSGIALKEDTLEDIIVVVKYVKLSKEEVMSIKNKEAKIKMYEILDIIPEDPVEFLRYVVYACTGKPLLIKSKEVIETIRESNIDKYYLLRKYANEYGLERLAEVFYRFKPIFLALRKGNTSKKIVNRIRRLAYKYHKPLPKDYLNCVTAKIKHDEFDTKTFKQELSKVNVFRKIRLAYALKFRLKEDVDSILYRIRNGKGYSTEFSFPEDKKPVLKRALNITINSIAEDIRRNVEGKKIYIPDNIVYTLPATEKQFSGYFPSGTYISIPKDMIVGVYWKNVKGRVDLDLSLIDPEEGKIGWDGYYRNMDRSVLFSGDMTDAKKGASELFYVKRNHKKEYIVFINFYNCGYFSPFDEVPFKIIVAKEEVSDFRKNYMVNPNNILVSVNSKISPINCQRVLGLLVVTSSENKFYFVETNLGYDITTGWTNEFIKNSRKFLIDYYTNSIKLSDVLKKAGAIFVEEKEDADIDLSPENLEKGTILNLLVSENKK